MFYACVDESAKLPDAVTVEQVVEQIMKEDKDAMDSNGVDTWYDSQDKPKPALEATAEESDDIMQAKLRKYEQQHQQVVHAAAPPASAPPRVCDILGQLLGRIVGEFSRSARKATAVL